VAAVVLTFMFLMIILGATDGRAPKGFAPIAIGLGLTLIHLVGIPVTNLSVNPARSTAPALFVGDWALQQLWPFWLAPLAGGAAAGAIDKIFAEVESPARELAREQAIREQYEHVPPGAPAPAPGSFSLPVWGGEESRGSEVPAPGDSGRRPTTP
jgi:hypothetical protein